MREIDIKRCVLRSMISRGFIEAGTVVASEAALAGHRRRIDLAIYGQKFVGLEIKSNFDNLSRLPQQLDVYIPFFDEVAIVVAERHVLKATEALRPETSLWVITTDGEMSLVRSACGTHTCSFDHILRYMPLRDLAFLVKRLGVKPASNHRSSLQIQAAVAPPELLRGAVVEVMKRRHGGVAVSGFDEAGGAGQVSTSDVEDLSRYRDRRRREQEVNIQNRLRRQEWTAALQAIGNRKYPNHN